MAAHVCANKDEKRGISRKNTILKMLEAMSLMEDGQVIAKIQSGVTVFVTMVEERDLSQERDGVKEKGPITDSKQLVRCIQQALQKVMYGEVVVYVQQKMPMRVKAVNQVRM